jgi:hypothetical protein
LAGNPALAVGTRDSWYVPVHVGSLSSGQRRQRLADRCPRPLGGAGVAVIAAISGSPDMEDLLWLNRQERQIRASLRPDLW